MKTIPHKTRWLSDFCTLGITMTRLGIVLPFTSIYRIGKSGNNWFIIETTIKIEPASIMAKQKLN